MRRLLHLSIALLLSGLVPIVGCGGGGGSPVGSSGAISVSIIFPPKSEGAVTQSLPVATNSVRVRVLSPDGQTPIVADRVVPRSGGGTQTASFDEVPVGPCLVRALAYESTNGTGRVIAQAEVLTAITAGALTQVSLITQALVVRVTVTPDTLDLEYNANFTLTATCFDADNNVVLDPVKWQSSSASVPVSANGKLTGAAEGSAQVKATHEATGVFGSCTVTVTRRHVARVVVTPNDALLRPPSRDKVQFTATAYDARGVAVPYATFTWSSDNAPAVTVDANGLASTTSTVKTAATITASAGEGTDGTATVRVEPTGKLGVDIE